LIISHFQPQKAICFNKYEVFHAEERGFSKTSNAGQKTRQPNSFQQVENLKANSYSESDSGGTLSWFTYTLGKLNQCCLLHSLNQTTSPGNTYKIGS